MRASPRDARAHYELSRAYMGRGRMREGAAELESAIRLDSHFLPAYHALQKYYRLTGRLDLELDILRRLTALHTQDPQSYVRLGQIYRGLYWLDDANQAFHQALLLAPNDASVLRETAKCDWASGRSDEAVRRLQAAHRLAPNDAETTSFLAQYLLATGRAPEAEVVLQEALTQRLDDRLLTPVLIFNLVHQGGKPRFQEAVGLSQEYLRTNPPTAAVYCWLGRAYDGLDMPAEAEAAYRNSVRLDPSFENATYLLGHSYIRQGRTKEGRRLISFYAEISSHLQTYVHAEEMVRSHINSPDAHLAVAQLDLLSRRYPEAVVEFRRVLELQPNHRQARAGLRTALSASGRSEERTRAGFRPGTTIHAQ